uniref:Mitochondrial import inner membrane translocase subunit TIM50 n=1 Tax=Globodera pallida TaxID=36090 RepID=A0A183C9X6_GLOPA
MNADMKKVLFNWTAVCMGGGMILTPVFIIMDRNLIKVRSTGPSNVANDKLRKLVNDELRTISAKRWNLVQPNDIKIQVLDDIESFTGGLFVFLNGAIFRFSSRLALDDVETIRSRYPNFFGVFKQNFAAEGEKDVKKVWKNFRTALGFRDLFAMFNEDLSHLSVDTSTLSDEDLQKVLLSPNAKKFAIARELLYADGMCGAMLATNGVFMFDRFQQSRNVFKLDTACMKLGDAYVSGAKEYLQSSIELGKHLHRLTDGAARFNASGDYERHIVSYSARLEAIEKAEMKLKSKRNKVAEEEERRTLH